jgi:nucleoside 2-deoxyribosyltransferase
MKPKIYLAAMFSLKDEIAKRKAELQLLGYTITSTWTEEKASPTCSLKDYGEDYHTLYAGRDIEEINSCDVLVLFTVDPDKATLRGGRHFESGYATGKQKQVVVVGPRENIFHYLPEVVVLNSWNQFVEELTEGEFDIQVESKGC